MDLYHIPGDTGFDWRWNNFAFYSDKEPDDTIGPMIVAMDELGYTKNQRIWATFLYSVSYCLGTALICSESLDYASVTVKDIDNFWLANKNKLLFTSDRRYVKNLNWFSGIVYAFLETTHRKPYKYIAQFVTENPKETYKLLYGEVIKWRGFGRFSAILFLRTLLRTMNITMDFDTGYDWRNGSTTTQGALLILYKDRAVQSYQQNRSKILTHEHMVYLDQVLLDLQLHISHNFPRKNPSLLYITSDLCSYFKLYKGTRYLGYYADRGLAELNTLKTNYPNYNSIFQAILKGRLAAMDPKYLGELSGWSGIRPERNHIFLNKGEFE